MAVPEKLVNWVNEMQNVLSPETVQALNRDLEDKDKADKFGRTVLAVADYSRQTQDLARQRQEVEDYLMQLKQWKNDKEVDLRRNDAETLQYKQALQQAQSQLQAITKSQEELIRQGVVDPSQLPVAAQTPVQPQAVEPTGNGKDYLTKKDLERFFEEKDTFYMGALALVNDINREHYQLFGQFPDTKRLMEISIRTRKPIEEVWANEYKVPDKRKELEDSAFNKRLEDELAKRLTAARSEEAIKGNTFRQGDPSSPIQAILQKDKERADKAGQSGGFTGTPIFRPAHPEVASPATEAAIAAFREGRFRPNNNSQ